MELKVIGAGLGRTGTLSLKTALEQLGFGPCYHMYETLSNVQHAGAWVSLAQAEPGSAEAVDEVLSRYGSTVDWPACSFWEHLAERHPEAKVVLSVRPPQRWYESFHDTIEQVIRRPAPPDLTDELRPLFELSELVVKHRTFGADLDAIGPNGIVAAYEAHNARVRAAIDPARLLELDVAQGWGPLCDFLGVDVPATPFPNVNDRHMFRELFGADEARPATGADVEERFRDALS